MKLLQNVWYASAYSEEVGRTLLGRKIAGVDILMYRREDGVAVAISNLCPHRFAPLDRGVLVGDTVQCGYHGLEFATDGRCTKNPHPGRITEQMHVRSFPLVERDGFVWIWTGTASADPSTVPDMGEFATTETSHATHNYIDARYRYDILIDNLLDLSHADYLHKGTLSGGAGEEESTEVFEDGDTVTVQRTQLRTPAPPLAGGGLDLADQRITMVWRPNQVITFRGAVTAPGGSFDDPLASFVFYHIGTPADEKTTHYFLGVRAPGPPDPEADRAKSEQQLRAIRGEDGPMLEAINAVMAERDLMDMRPALLSVDVGPMRARTVMKRLLEAEA